MVMAATSTADLPAAGRDTATTNGRAAITCAGVTVRFVTDRRTVTALDSVSFEVAEGSFLPVLGPSGCGKSTLLRVVADLVMPSGGAGTILDCTPKQARHGPTLAFGFQSSARTPWRTAIATVTLPLD